jgi:hypothetical protein
MQFITEGSSRAGRRVMTRWGVVMLASVGMMALAAPAHANLVQNPGFETGDLTGWVSNTAAGDAWRIGPTDTPAHSGSFDATTGCVGAQCVDLTNPGGAATLSQALATVAGATYNLTFWFGGDGTADELKVVWGGNVVLDLVGSDGDIVLNNGTGETEYTVSNLLATSNSTTLEFAGRQDPGWDGLDDIDVEPTGSTTTVPEPASLALLGTALAGFGWLRRRKA